MSKADFTRDEKYLELPCNCHPETCACGGTRLKKNSNYSPRKKVKNTKKKK
jgi:hypothetical protein